MEQRRIGVQPPQQNPERSKVIERADRSDGQHEVANGGDIPPLRPRQVLGIHMVGRDRGLREVIQEIVEQDLGGQHGQEGQDRCADRHAEHVSEVGAGSHEEIFGEVGEGPASFDDPRMQHTQVASTQDDVDRILGDVDGVCHRNTYVGCMKRGRVVDAIAQESHDLIARLEGQSQTMLLGRREPGEQRGVLAGERQGIIIQSIDLRAQQRATLRQPDFGAHVSGHALVVAGDNSHLDTVVGQLLQGSADAGAIGSTKETNPAKVRPNSSLGA